jgi:hypothetical protein
LDEWAKHKRCPYLRAKIEELCFVTAFQQHIVCSGQYYTLQAVYYQTNDNTHTQKSFVLADKKLPRLVVLRVRKNNLFSKVKLCF